MFKGHQDAHELIVRIIGELSDEYVEQTMDALLDGCKAEREQVAVEFAEIIKEQYQEITDNDCRNCEIEMLEQHIKQTQGEITATLSEANAQFKTFMAKTMRPLPPENPDPATV